MSDPIPTTDGPRPRGIGGPIGIGTWAWGDARYWGYGSTFGMSDIAAAFDVARAAGITLFDTAEIYGRGASERILGSLIRGRAASTSIATKYMPFPWRWRSVAVRRALDQSLSRLGLETVDLYQVHWPLGTISHRRLARALAGAVRDGRVRQVGVSNFSAGQMRRFHAYLASEGVALASNQVAYSLTRRAPEVNGVMEACQELGVSLIAYSPLGQGLLTGKYDAQHQPAGVRRRRRQFRTAGLRRAGPVLTTLREVAAEHTATPAQIALAWLMRQPRVVPIPGVKTAEQTGDVVGTLDITLTDADVARLDGASRPFRTAPALASRFVG